MALSYYNRIYEARRAAKLTLTESRLLDAIVRRTLGYKVIQARMGEGTLRPLALLDGRSFIRARQGLIDKGLIDYEPGKPGRGHAALYRLRFRDESALPERVFMGAETPAVERVLVTTPKPPRYDKKTPAVERGHKGSLRVKDAGKVTNHELVGQVIANYSAQGGNLGKEGWRAMLAKHATQLLKAGNEVDLIVTAAGLLARDEDGYPGNLTKLVKQIQAEGMPCKHRGNQRGLTKAQLEECGCRECLGRIAFAEAKGLDTAYLQPLKAA